MNYLDNRIFKVISELSSQRGQRAFVIGGYVRDCFLGRACNDIDVVVEGSGIDFALALGEKLHKKVSYFKNFGTAMLHFEGLEIEFVGARKESYRRESRKPIVEDGSLKDDQMRRDFTINAMAFSLQKEDFGALVDPFGGIRDLNDGIIRTPLDPETTFSDDPLRMLRAIRFAAKLSTPERKFTIVPEAIAAMQKMAERLEILSQERISDELNKMMISPYPSMAIRLLDKSGLLPYILPEISALKGVETFEGKGHKDNYQHTLEVLDHIVEKTDSLYLRWAALLHDIGKPKTKKFEPGIGWTFWGHEVLGAKMIVKVFNRLRLPIDQMKYVQKLVRLHLRPIALVDSEVTDSAVRRLLFDAGEDIDDLMTLCHCDITSKNELKVARIHSNFELVQQKLIEVEAKDAIRNFKNPITGEYVMEVYGIEPCREIGILKEYVKEAILDGIISNTFEEADKYMRIKAQEMGL